MSNRGENGYVQLLRWYPRAWRKDHGHIMLDTLKQHASERGSARPSISEAWSIRAHGLGTRATRRWAAVSAGAALLAYLIASWLLLSNAIVLAGAESVYYALAFFVAPLALTLSGVVLLHRRGQLSAPAALLTAVSAIPAWAFAAFSAASWSVGFDEAYAGPGSGWFGSSTLIFLGLAWIAGTFTLVAPVSSVLPKIRIAAIRVLLPSLLAVIAVPVVGILIQADQTIGVFGAAALLVIALRGDPSAPTPSKRQYGPILGKDSATISRPRLTRRGYLVVSVWAGVSLILGVGCVVFALTGSLLSPVARDSTHAMNLGLAAGALAAIPIVFAYGMTLFQRYGAFFLAATLICCGSLVLESAAQTMGADHLMQWPLTLASALLMGTALALPSGRLFPGRGSFRIGVRVALALAASTIGIFIVTMAAFIAPLGAAALLIWSLGKLSKRKQQPNLPMVYPS